MKRSLSAVAATLGLAGAGLLPAAAPADTVELGQ
jgi:hypothetical protein